MLKHIEHQQLYGQLIINNMLKTKKIFSVIGAGFGDEGKGITVDYLCSKNPDTIVLRHSGGHQVGHSVKLNDMFHEFRHFGSGTFRKIPTLWGENCTISPLQFEIEFKQMQNQFNITPEFYYYPHSPITTLYDIAYNRAKEKSYKCGSTGVGFAATLKRHEILPLFAMDIRYPYVIEKKLNNIASYYLKQTNDEGIFDLYTDELGELSKLGYSRQVFETSCQFFIDNADLESDLNSSDYGSIIYEGNQGILLDKYHGFYPNVTYGFTTNRTIQYDNLRTYYITRCYGTRHGFGPLVNENLERPILKNNEFEANHLNPYQDNFRTAILDYNMLEYAIKCDQSYKKNIESNLVITCMDQIAEPKITKNGLLQDLNPNMFKSLVDFVWTNNSPESKTFRLCQ